LTDKAFIKKRGLARSSEAFSLENDTAKKFGLSVEKSSPEGTLISGNREQFRNIESEGFRVKILPNTNILEIGSFRIDTEKESHGVSAGISLTENFKKESFDFQPTLSIPENFKENWIHYLVQLKEPPTGDLIRAIEDNGVDVVESISSYGLFVVGKPENVYKLKDNLTFVDWVGPFLPAYRINNNLIGLEGKIKYVSIGIYPPSNADSVKQTVVQLNGIIISEAHPTEGYQGEYFKIIAELNSESLPKLASLPSIRWLEYASPMPGLDGERETQIIAHNLNNSKPITGYKTWLSNIGLSGRDVVITICDTGVDANQSNNTNGHSDLRGRQIKFIDYTNGRYLTDTDGHGTHVAGICVGNAGSNMKEENPPDDFLWGQGIAPASRYVTQNALFGRWPPTDWGNLTRDAVNAGANIMNNSWYDGGPHGSGYTASARRFDQLCRDPISNSTGSDINNLIIIFSAGNAGRNGTSSITPPHEAKNPIIVGNSSTYRPNLGNNDIRGLTRSSSRGPAKDGRILPTIVAPGTNVSSAWSPTGNVIDWGNPIPNTSEKYMFGTGTSMAAPHVSGCCALLVEWWKKRTNGKIPSLALLKAILINSALDIAGGSSGRPDGSRLDHIPNNDQGWGLVNLKEIFKNGDIRIFSDQKNPFTATGEEHSIQVKPSNTNQEIRITLVWTDAPGATDANPSLVNDLDLEVVELATDKTYKGNNFSDGHSIEGGDFDNLNNIECVYIKNPTGTYEINVIASNIAGNARPPFNMTPLQDYVLVMSNVKTIEGTNNGIIID